MFNETLNVAFLSVMAVAVTAGVGMTSLSGDAGEDEAFQSPHQVQANVYAELNGEKVAEKKNVMLNGERIITHQVTGDAANDDDDAQGETYNTIALGAVTDGDNCDEGQTTGVSLDTEGPESGHTDLTESGLRYRYSTASGDQDTAVQNEACNTYYEGFDPEVGTITLDGTEESWDVVHEFELGESPDEDVMVSSTALEVDGVSSFTRDETEEVVETNTFAATDLGREIPMRENDRLEITWEVTPQNE